MRNAITRKRLAWLAAAMCVALFVRPLVAGTSAQPGSHRTQATPGPPESREIQELRAALGGTRLTTSPRELTGVEDVGRRVPHARLIEPQVRQQLEEKLAILLGEAAARAAPQADAAAKPSGLRPAGPTPAPDLARPRGIVEEVQGPFSSQEITVENAWQEQVNGQWVQVYAGALASDPAQGVVIVLAQTSEGMSGSRHPTPVKAGAVRLVSADGLRLTLVAASGATIYFDAAARQFVPPPGSSD